MVYLTLSKKAEIDMNVSQYMKKFKDILNKESIDTTDILTFFTDLEKEYIKTTDFDYSSYVYGKISEDVKKIMEEYKEQKKDEEIYLYTIELIENMRNESNLSITSYEEFEDEIQYQKNILLKIDSDYLSNNNDIFIDVNAGKSIMNEMVRYFSKLPNFSEKTGGVDKEESVKRTDFETIKKLIIENNNNLNEEIIDKIYQYGFKYHEINNGNNEMYKLIDVFNNINTRCEKIATHLKYKIQNTLDYSMGKNIYNFKLVDSKAIFEELYNIMDFYQRVEEMYEDNKALFESYNKASNKTNTLMNNINKYVKNYILIYYFYPYIIQSYYPDTLNKLYEDRNEKIKKMKNFKEDDLWFAYYDLNEIQIKKGNNIYQYEDIYYNLINELIIRKPMDIKTHLYFFKKLYEMMHEVYFSLSNLELFDKNQGEHIEKSIFDHFEEIDDHYKNILDFAVKIEGGYKMDPLLTPARRWKSIEEKFIQLYKETKLYDSKKVKTQPFDYTKLEKDDPMFFSKEDINGTLKYMFIRGANYRVADLKAAAGLTNTNADPKNQDIKILENFLLNKLNKIIEMPNDIRKYFNKYSDLEYNIKIKEDKNYFRNILTESILENKENLNRMRNFFNDRKGDLYKILFDNDVYYSTPKNTIFTKHNGNLTTLIQKHHLSNLSKATDLRDRGDVSATKDSIYYYDDTIFYYIHRYINQLENFSIEWKHAYPSIKFDEIIQSLKKTYSDVSDDILSKSVMFNFHIHSLVNHCLENNNFKLLKNVLQYIKYSGIFEYTNEYYPSVLNIEINNKKIDHKDKYIEIIENIYKKTYGNIKIDFILDQSKKSKIYDNENMLLNIYENINETIKTKDIIDHFTNIGNILKETNENGVNINIIMLITHKILYTLFSLKSGKVESVGNILYDMQTIANDNRLNGQYAAILFLGSLRKLTTMDIKKQKLINTIKFDADILKKVEEFIKNNDFFALNDNLSEKNLETKNKSLKIIVEKFRKNNKEKEENLEEKLKHLDQMIVNRRKKDENVFELFIVKRQTNKKLNTLKKQNKDLFSLFEEKHLELSDIYVSNKHFIEKSHKFCEHIEIKKNLNQLNGRLSNINFLLNDYRKKLEADGTNKDIKNNISTSEEKIENIKIDIARANQQLESFLTGSNDGNSKNTICNRCGEILMADNLIKYGKGSFEEQEESNEIKRYLRESNELSILNKEKEIEEYITKVASYVRNIKIEIDISRPSLPGFNVDDINFDILHKDSEIQDQDIKNRYEHKSTMFKYMNDNYKMIYAIGSKIVRSSFKQLKINKMSNEQRIKVKHFFKIYFKIATYIHIIYHILNNNALIKLDKKKLDKSKAIQYEDFQFIYKRLYSLDNTGDAKFFEGFDVNEKLNETYQINFYIDIYNTVISQDSKFKDIVKFKLADKIVTMKKSEKLYKEIEFHTKIRGDYIKPLVTSKKEKDMITETMKKNELINKKYILFLYNLKNRLNIVEKNDIDYYKYNLSTLENLEHKNNDTEYESNDLRKLIVQGEAKKSCDTIIKGVYLLLKKDYLIAQRKSKYNTLIGEIDELVECNQWDNDNFDLSSQKPKYNDLLIYNNFVLLYLHIKYSASHVNATGYKIDKVNPELKKELDDGYSDWYHSYKNSDVMDLLNTYIKNDSEMIELGINNINDIEVDYTVLQLYLLKLFNVYKKHIDSLINTFQEINDLIHNEKIKIYFDKKGNITEEDDNKIESNSENKTEIEYLYDTLITIVNKFISENIHVHKSPTKKYIKQMIFDGFTIKNEDETINIESLTQFYKKITDREIIKKLKHVQSNLTNFDSIIKSKIDYYDRFKNQLLQYNINIKRSNIYVNMLKNDVDLYDIIKRDKISKDVFDKGLDDKYHPKNQKLLTKLDFIKVSNKKGVYLNTLVPYLYTAEKEDEIATDKMIRKFQDINKFIKYHKKKDEPIYIPSRESEDMNDLNRLYGKLYRSYLDNLYFLQTNEKEEYKISEMCRKSLETLVSKLDESMKPLKEKLDGKVYNDIMTSINRIVESMKETGKMEFVSSDMSYKKLIKDTNKIISYTRKASTLELILNNYNNKFETIVKQYQVMLNKNIKKTEDKELKKSIKEVSLKQFTKLNINLIEKDEKNMRNIDLKIDQKTTQRFIKYGKGDRLYINKNLDENNEYNETKNKNFVMNVFKYFIPTKTVLIRRKEPIESKQIEEEMKSWYHVPYFNKWNKLRFIQEEEYIPYCILASLVHKLNGYCAENYIKHDGDHTIKGVYDMVEDEPDITEIDTNVIYYYYYERNTKFLKNVFPLTTMIHTVHLQDSKTIGEIKSDIDELLKKHLIVKYDDHVNNVIIYGYGSKYYYEDDSTKEKWERDQISLSKLHQDYALNKLKEINIEESFEKLKEILVDPNKIYQYTDLLQEYIDKYFDIIHKHNKIKIVQLHKNTEILPIRNIYIIEEYQIIKYQLLKNQGKITKEEDEQLQELIFNKMERITKNNNKKKYEYKIEFSNTDFPGVNVEMSEYEKTNNVLKKLRIQFMSGRIMQHTFKEINNLILEFILKDTFLKEQEDVNDKFNTVFKTTEVQNLKLDNLSKIYEVANKKKLFKMFSEYNSDNSDNSILEKFKNMYDYYPEESTENIQTFLNKKDEKTMPFCYYLLIRKQINNKISVSQNLELDSETESKMTNDQIIEMYREKHPYYKVEIIDNDYILVCPKTSMLDLTSQIESLTVFLDPIIQSIKDLSNGSYNAFLDNNQNITEIENTMFNTIQKLGTVNENSLKEFILSFDKKTIRKFIDSRAGADNTLDYNFFGKLLNKVLKSENVSLNRDENENTLSSLYDLEEKLENKIKEGDSEAESMIKNVRKRIKNIIDEQRNLNDEIDSNLEDINKRNEPEDIEEDIAREEDFQYSDGEGEGGDYGDERE